MMTDAEKDAMVNRFLTLMRSEFLSETEKRMLDSAMNDFRTEENRVNDMVSTWFAKNNTRHLKQLEKRMSNNG